MHAKIDTIPESIAPAKQARNAAYRLDRTGEWIAEVDVLPDGAVEITEAEYDSLRADIEAYNAALPEPEPPPPPPDPQGFMAGALNALGRDVAFDLANAYPAILTALREGDYDTARWGVERMKADGAITEEQRQSIHALMTEANIPDPTE